MRKNFFLAEAVSPDCGGTSRWLRATDVARPANGILNLGPGATWPGLVLAFALLAGCAGTPDTDTPEAMSSDSTRSSEGVERSEAGEAGGDDAVNAPVSAEENDRFQGAVAGQDASGDGDADELLRELRLQGEERRVASQAATRDAERFMSELRYQDAERKLQEALRLDSENEKARELLDRVLFILGDIRGEYKSIARQESERERVRRQLTKLELQKMITDGINLMQDGDFQNASRTFRQVLDRVSWYPYNYDLSEIQREAEKRLEEAEEKAQAQVREERRRLEDAAIQQSEFERERSLKFVRNRIERLEERLDRAWESREYDEVIELADKILELDRTNREAKYYLEKGRQFRHLSRTLSIADRTREEWDRTFLSQLESGIPYARIFNFPDEDKWREISAKRVAVSSRARVAESAETQQIELQLRKPVDVRFDEDPFDEVIDFLQDISSVNMVLTRAARDAIEEDDEPVRLAPVKGLPLRNVLQLILEPREFTFVIKDGAVVIGPSDDLREDLRLEFYEVKDLTTAPPDFVAPKLALDEDEGSDGGGGASSILQLGDDEATGGTELESDVLVELVEKTIFGQDLDDQGEGESVEYQSGKLVVNSTYEKHEKVATLLEALRKSTGVMVTVESRFLDLQDNFLEQIGVDFGNPNGTNLPNSIPDIDGSGTSIGTGYEFVDAQGQTNVRGSVYNAFSQPLGGSVAPFNLSASGGFALQYNVLDTFVLEAILEATAKTQEFKKLDAPRVTAFNGQISHSLVIEQSAYIKDAEVNQTGVVPVINPVIGILNSGSILQVRPTVSHDRKYVILEIEPTLAVQLPSRFRTLTLNLTVLNVEFPVLSVTNIKTTVTVPDGGTVLVGGLKRTITQKQRVGPPWTRSIPFVDILFGRKGTASLQSNLFVLINAQITVIRDQERALFN